MDIWLSLLGKSVDGNWEWGGCGDNVYIGYERSKDILDKIRRRRRHSNIRTLMLLHNNEAGRLVSVLYFFFLFSGHEI